MLSNANRIIRQQTTQALQKHLAVAEARHFSTARHQSEEYIKPEGLRPYHEKTTDLSYLREGISKDDVLQMAYALGVPDIKMITTYTPNADRAFLHTSLNLIQTRIRSDETDETARGEIIADTAKKIHSAIKGDYDTGVQKGKLEGMPFSLQERLSTANNFVTRIARSEQDRPWDVDSFNERWSSNIEPEKHETNAIKAYRTIRDRIETGQYTPSNGMNAEDLTRLYMDHNMIYKHQRRMGIVLTDDYIHENIPDNEKLTLYPCDQRKGIIICGGMSSGKSYLTSSNPCLDVSHQNADFVKPALWLAAVEDGVISKNDGLEVTQNESSIVAYESRLTRCFDARSRWVGPNVMINSIAFNKPEVQEFLDSGKEIEAHHVSMDVEQAVKDSAQRALRIGRKPNEEAVRKSYEDSARSILNVTQYQGENIHVNLYDREKGSPPELNATINCETCSVDILDKKAFIRTISRANLGQTQEESAAIFIDKLKQAGYTINEKQKDEPEQEKEKTISAKTSAPKRVIIDSSQEETLSAINLSNLGQYIGSNVKAYVFDGKASEGNLGAVFDCKEGVMNIHDQDSLMNALSKSNLSPGNMEESAKMLFNKFQKDGFKIIDKSQPNLHTDKLQSSYQGKFEQPQMAR